MNAIKKWFGLLMMTPVTAFAWQWMDLWHTPNQQGAKLLQQGQPKAAAHIFQDEDWQAVAYYRAGDYARAFKAFHEKKTSDGQYNAGNAAAYSGKYQEAIAAYNQALALNADNKDAMTNREIVKKILEQQESSSQDPSQQKNQNNASDQNKQNNQKNQNNQQKQEDQEKQSDQQKQENQDNQNNQDNPQNQQDQENKQDQKSQPNQENQQEQQKSQQQDQKNDAQKDQEKNQDSRQSDSNHSQQQSQTAVTTAQRQEDSNKQLLRRLTDDPGSLLQQKFLRDYARRHGVDVDADQGENG